MARRFGPATVLVTALLAAALVAAAFFLFRSRAGDDAGSLTQPSTLPTLAQPSVPPAGGPATSGGPNATAPAEPKILLAVGDIADCDTLADEAVARLASRLPGTIALLGDTVYESGSPAEYRDCFDPAWGPMRSRIRPAIGNHEYGTPDADGYFDYFGDAAGEPGKGWYSYDLGTWHVVVLNSNCEGVVGCDAGSEQHDWLESDLAAHDGDCLLAYWHHPRLSSGRHGSNEAVDPLWELLRAHGADVVLNGHDHDYERIRAEGVQEFVVGTGGESHYPFPRPPLPGTQVRNDSTYGLLWLALGDGTYQWDFLGLGDSGFADSGRGTC